MRLRLRAERGFAALGERLGVVFNVLIQEVKGNHHECMPGQSHLYSKMFEDPFEIIGIPRGA
jgi:hypothetical protein